MIKKKIAFVGKKPGLRKTEYVTKRMNPDVFQDSSPVLDWEGTANIYEQKYRWEVERRWLFLLIGAMTVSILNVLFIGALLIGGMR